MLSYAVLFCFVFILGLWSSFHEIALLSSLSLNHPSIVLNCRNTKQLSEPDDLFISFVSLSYVLAFMEYWPHLGRKYTSFLNIVSV